MIRIIETENGSRVWVFQEEHIRALLEPLKKAGILYRIHTLQELPSAECVHCTHEADVREALLRALEELNGLL